METSLKTVQPDLCRDLGKPEKIFSKSLYIDSILIQVDVIVNSTNGNVDLNANSCGRALLKVAGKKLMKECKKIGSLQAGNMASTGPAKLKCKRVYHVRSSPWNNGKGARVMLA